MTGDIIPLHGAQNSIEIGDLCQIGSTVQILPADHPRSPALRREDYENGIPVHIGKSVWIGSGAIIGAGSMVTRDVPAGATVMGNPARAPSATLQGLS